LSGSPGAVPVREIDISDRLLPRQHDVLRCLGLLATQLNPDRWCLVGGLVVLVAGRGAGYRDSRAEGTNDGDVVVEPELLARAAHILMSLGHTFPPGEDRGEGFAGARSRPGTPRSTFWRAGCAGLPPGRVRPARRTG